MKTSLTLTLLPLVLAACGSAQRQTNAPVQTNGALTGAPVCLSGGLVPAHESMVDYGTTYTPDMDGPAPTTPDRRIVDCDELRRVPEH